MNLDRTQHQSTNELKKAAELSLEPTRPPAQIPGYQLIKFLGSGAYGEVWSADDLKTGRRVAIKFYTRRSATDVQLLASEVEKLVVLAADRYVVQLLDVGWDADPPYYVMDYLEHGSLEDRMTSPAGIVTNEAIDLFQELATGLLHLHGKGILHCDLKPGNVLLDQDGKPRVADFGQSRLSTEQTSALGTLFYMAPEQADLAAVPDARWDVYGLGALLFSMLTGRPPYHTNALAQEIDSIDDIHQRLLTYRDRLKAAAKPTEHRAVDGVDRSLAEIIDNCIAADPKLRFSNIQSVMLALRERELVKARRPLMILGLLGPVLLLGLMSLFGGWAFRQAVDRSQSAIIKKADDSNQFAAQLAARSAAEQIDEYFRVVGQLSRDDELHAIFKQVINDDELKKLRLAISDPKDNAIEFEEPDVPRSHDVVRARQAFRGHPLRMKLQEPLEKRLFDQSGEYPLAASWFISDRYGNQIASAFREKNLTLGKNYSWRSYFTGLNYDLTSIQSPDDDVKSESSFQVSGDPEQRQILSAPHLSAVFISMQSNTWKVAFSAPLMLDGEVAGVVAVTVDLGNLIEFENVEDHYAMMVDSREGAHNGIVLEHPLFKKVLSEQGRIPDELAGCRVDIKLVEETKRFVDPVGGTEFGKSQKYNRESIVATAAVTMLDSKLSARNDSDPNAHVGRLDLGSDATASLTEVKRKQTGFVVLAVEDLSSVVAPANDLRRQLGRLAALASLFLIGVAVAMWLFVKRMLRESIQQLDRAFSPSAESTEWQDLETLPASVKGD